MLRLGFSPPACLAAGQEPEGQDGGAPSPASALSRLLSHALSPLVSRRPGVGYKDLLEDLGILRTIGGSRTLWMNGTQLWTQKLRIGL